MITYTTQAAALAESVDTRTGDVLIRFVNGDDVLTYQWVTELDIQEMLSYGDDDFDVIMDYTTQVHSASSENVPAFVDSSEWDDRDNG